MTKIRREKAREGSSGSRLGGSALDGPGDGAVEEVLYMDGGLMNTASDPGQNSKDAQTLIGAHEPFYWTGVVNTVCVLLTWVWYVVVPGPWKERT